MAVAAYTYESPPEDLRQGLTEDGPSEPYANDPMNETSVDPKSTGVPSSFHKGSQP